MPVCPAMDKEKYRLAQVPVHVAVASTTLLQVAVCLATSVVKSVLVSCLLSAQCATQALLLTKVLVSVLVDMYWI